MVMSIISHGDTFEIYPSELKTHGDKLPVGTYKVRFAKMQGFFLEKVASYTATEEKVYGNHEEKADKVIKTFAKSNRSLGVLLSGPKGIGKSLFTNILSKKMLDLEVPVILVETGYFGIKDFLASIDQEVVIIFDEFEKNFSNSGTDSDSRVELQSNLLGLFDGTVNIKHLYVLTINNLHRLNEFFIDRPGRLHYHFRFANPNAEEVAEYLDDNIDKSALADPYSFIVQTLSRLVGRISLNFDSLRAIVTELNSGFSLQESLDDLNISDEQTSGFDILLEVNGSLIRSGTYYGSMINPTAKVSVNEFIPKTKGEYGIFSAKVLDFIPQGPNFFAENVTFEPDSDNEVFTSSSDVPEKLKATIYLRNRSVAVGGINTAYLDDSNKSVDGNDTKFEEASQKVSKHTLSGFTLSRD